jgi:hypothetical protein
VALLDDLRAALCVQPKAGACGDISPLYPEGTWPCDLVNGHDGFHMGGDWIWCDREPEPDELWRAVLSMKGAQE